MAQQRQQRPSAFAVKIGVAVVLVVGAGWLIASALGVFEVDPATTTLAFPPETDVAYGPDQSCKPSQVPCSPGQSVDIYRSSTMGPNPVVVWLHGGGFVAGDKAGGLDEDLQTLLDGGWDIVAANYRLADEGGINPFPAAMNDVKRVIRWVKANASANDWDPDAVAVMGHSAGGNLAAMLAVTPNVTALEDPALPPELAAVDSSVVAAVAIAPVSDVEMFGAQDYWSEMVAMYTNCTDCPEARHAASVQTYVDASAAPLLILHGVDDPIAGRPQAQRVIDAFEAAGIEDRLEVIIVEDGPEEHRGHNPDFGRWTEDFLKFLDTAVNTARRGE